MNLISEANYGMVLSQEFALSKNRKFLNFRLNIQAVLVS